MTTAEAAIAAPADTSGLKIRTMEKHLHIAASRSAAVLPTPMGFSELPTALQQGSVDGQEKPIPVTLANTFDQLRGSLDLKGQVYSPGIIVGSPDFLNGLAEADRAIFQAVAIEAARGNRSVVKADEARGKDRGTDRLCQRGRRKPDKPHRGGIVMGVTRQRLTCPGARCGQPCGVGDGHVH